jgi:hypothetical protein
VSSTIEVERTETQVPLELVVTQSGIGGITGLVPVARIRDGNTPNSYLDFNDFTFKIAGWVAQTISLTEVGNGFYTEFLDLTAITNLPDATHYLNAEFIVSGAGAVKGSGLTQILLSRGAYDSGGTLVSSTVTGISTTTVLATGFTEPDSFFLGNLLKVTDGANVATRRIEDHTAGAFTVFPELPFTPSVGSILVVLSDNDPRFGGL